MPFCFYIMFCKIITFIYHHSKNYGTVQRTVLQSCLTSSFRKINYLVEVYHVNNSYSKQSTGYLLIPVLTDSWSLIIFCTIIVSTVIEWSISFSNRSSSSLVIKMPMKTCKWPMLCTLMLKKRWALLHSELLQISGTRNNETWQKLLWITKHNYANKIRTCSD